MGQIIFYLDLLVTLNNIENRKLYVLSRYRICSVNSLLGSYNITIQRAQMRLEFNTTFFNSKLIGILKLIVVYFRLIEDFSVYILKHSFIHENKLTFFYICKYIQVKSIFYIYFLPLQLFQ